jgi:cytochrome P450
MRRAYRRVQPPVRALWTNRGGRLPVDRGDPNGRLVPARRHVSESTGPDWDPKSPSVLTNQIAAYDDMRQRCPVANSDYLNWSLFRHEDVMRVLNEPETFSNAVSAHLSIPNGMDPPEHTTYRQIVDRYFSAERMATFDPACRRIAVDLVEHLPSGSELELMESVCPGAPLARLELRVLMEELLEHTDQIDLVQGKEPVMAAYPASGFSSLPLWIH